jgi:DNA-binding transcriptional ArsR family regulator
MDAGFMELDYAEMFKVLAVESRVKIIELLKTRGPLGAKEIGRLLGITPAAASQHLKILKQAGLVRNERQGYWIPYALNVEALEKYRQILSKVCTCGCQGTGKWQEKEIAATSLESLQQYERNLKAELTLIHQRIKELEKK